MRTMIDLGSQRGSGLYIIDTSTAVDCTKDVRFGRRSFRSLIECVVPCCAGFPISSNASAFDEDDSDNNSTAAAVTAPAPTVAAATTVTGTFFGHRRGRVRFCVHDHAAAPPLLLLEFTVPTAYLAREMQHGLLRVALESGGGGGRGPLLSTPVWTMYCNGRKVGFAIRRRATEADAEVFRLMRSVSAGTGILPAASAAAAAAGGEAGDLLYMRASFERVIGSTDSESFHMIDPAGGRGGQQLSIFLFRT
ncbi:protein MIZU-KUSSEI 1-like [Zingiber officinale]|nr:protein MIZU-KUSSEI 1-like [Zingiber officinale]XP_042454760.1 protein MIZU-KUSSEI 1-like [Zingiber officinale]